MQRTSHTVPVNQVPGPSGLGPQRLNASPKLRSSKKPRQHPSRPVRSAAVPRVNVLVYQYSHRVQPRAQPQLRHRDHGKVDTIILRQIYRAFAKAALRITCIGDALSLAPESVNSFHARSQGFVI